MDDPRTTPEILQRSIASNDPQRSAAMEAKATGLPAHPRIITSNLPRSPIGPWRPRTQHNDQSLPLPHSNHSSPGPSSPTERHSSSTSASALARHQLHRSLSPDLPIRDALYLFCNFSSYMRSPYEGAEGIKDNTDFHDTIRLLDFARTLSENPHTNVHILHLKYRFQTPDQNHNTSKQQKQGALDYRDAMGRQSTTVPQPFSTLHDPVIKVDYHDDGMFEPLPAQAVFQHISKTCQPPPRIIVVSYVSSYAIETHVAALAAWAHTSTPPIYVFSPLETRLRIRQSLADELHHGIPISMYAWPVGAEQSGAPSPQSANTATTQSTDQPDSTSRGLERGKLRSHSHGASGSATATSSRIIRQASTDSRVLSAPHANSAPGSSPRTYPPDPVATLSVVTNEHQADIMRGVEPAGDRIPLWMLAPGAGIMHGSTPALLGVKLSDFSAVNLDLANDGGATRIRQQSAIAQGGRAVDRPITVLGSSFTNVDDMGVTGLIPQVSLPLLDPAMRRTMATMPEPITRPDSANSTKSRKINGVKPPVRADVVEATSTMITTHLTPPKQDPRHLSPPDLKPPAHAINAVAGAGHESAEPRPTTLSSSQQSWPLTRSWPATRERVPGWKRGRREIMEDALDELGSRTSDAGVPEMMQVDPTARLQHVDAVLAGLQGLCVSEQNDRAGRIDLDIQVDEEDVVMAALFSDT